MPDASFIIDHYQGQQGWDDGTVLDLLLEFIDNRGASDALDDFLRARAGEENDL